MKIVMTYTVGDGYTWSALETVPVEYHSVEDLFIDFTNCLDTCKRQKTDKFELANREFRVCDFIVDGRVYMPDIETLEEWFENNLPRIGG